MGHHTQADTEAELEQLKKTVELMGYYWVIEIQSEQRERIAEILQKLGYKVKIAGG